MTKITLALNFAAASLLMQTGLMQTGFAQTAVLTYHNDNFRTGGYRQETKLTPANVNSTTFGKLFVIPADGLVDAQPLYVPGISIVGGTHNVVFVATENDTVYAYDADTSGSPLWQTRVLKSGESPSDNRGCGQITPQIGVTSTPAIDTKMGPHGTMYLVAMSKDSSGNYHQRVHALDITTGAEEFGGPVDVAASYPGTGENSSNGRVIFDPKQYDERAAILISNGAVITSWGSHCDAQPYTGWVMSYSETSLAQLSVIDFTPNGSEGSVWQSGNGPAADSAGNIYFLAANGTFDTSLNGSGFPSQGDYGNAFVKLSNSNNTLAVADYFTMFNTVSESNSDEDFGSGGEMLLPALPVSTSAVQRVPGGAGTSGIESLNSSSGMLLPANPASTVQLAVGAGKDSNIYIVNRTNMGKFNSSSNNIYQELVGALPGGVWGSPAYYYGHIYYGAVGDYIRSFVWQKGAFAASTKTTHQFGYPGVTPAVSSNGKTNAILWASENVSPAVLYAYSATNLATELYDSNQAGTRDQFGNGNKFITPMVANGKVYVGTSTGVGVFGLLP